MRALIAASSSVVASLTAERSAGQQRTSRSSGAIMQQILPSGAGHLHLPAD
jgi:hypothetical protein